MSVLLTIVLVLVFIAGGFFLLIQWVHAGILGDLQKKFRELEGQLARRLVERHGQLSIFLRALPSDELPSTLLLQMNRVEDCLARARDDDSVGRGVEPSVDPDAERELNEALAELLAQLQTAGVSAWDLPEGNIVRQMEFQIIHCLGNMAGLRYEWENRWEMVGWKSALRLLPSCAPLISPDLGMFPWNHRENEERERQRREDGRPSGLVKHLYD